MHIIQKLQTHRLKSSMTLTFTTLNLKLILFSEDYENIQDVFLKHYAPEATS